MQTQRNAKGSPTRATTTTAASGGNREELLGQRPAGRECKTLHEADAGSRNPDAGERSETERFNPQTNKNSQRRGKEEKAALPVYENSQTFAAVRRWLVVCPPPWLLPRISRGQFFLKGPRRPVSARDARFSLPAWHLGRMFFCSSLTAPLLYRIKMEFLCEEFEQIENKRSRCTSFCTAAPFFTIFL